MIGDWGGSEGRCRGGVGSDEDGRELHRVIGYGGRENGEASRFLQYVVAGSFRTSGLLPFHAAPTNNARRATAVPSVAMRGALV
jgi:hypothetical protein